MGVAGGPAAGAIGEKGYAPHALPTVECPEIDGYIYNHHTPSMEDAYAAIERLEGEKRVIARIFLLTGAVWGSHLDGLVEAVSSDQCVGGSRQDRPSRVRRGTTDKTDSSPAMK